MKKIFSIALLISSFGTTKSQTFSIVNIDTIAYNSPGYIVSCNAIIENNSSVGYYVDVIRSENDTAPSWYTSFCLDVCYPPSTDSARFYLLPDSSQSFLLEFFTYSVPDSSTVLMKFKNVSNPGNSVFQRYYGVTQLGFGVDESFQDKTDVKIFPSPVSTNSTFCFRITDREQTSGDYSLLIYDMLTSKTIRMDNLMNGDNYLSLNLPEGLYVYSLIRSGVCAKTGKIGIRR